ncbi:transposase [Rhodococcus sp. ZPP]|uniref:transposase n=1 Tax=Rhodococcus sp. ZPP TaxID=2749906 RepID=UPI001FCE000C|nr:transposase [Rhodococcus sp. ZPP]
MILDTILHLVRGRIAWRQLPADFPPPTTVYDVFTHWVRAGVAAHPRRAARPATGASQTRPMPDRGGHRLADLPAADTVPRSSRDGTAGNGRMGARDTSRRM